MASSRICDSNVSYIMEAMAGKTSLLHSMWGTVPYITQTKGGKTNLLAKWRHTVIIFFFLSGRQWKERQPSCTVGALSYYRGNGKKDEHSSRNMRNCEGTMSYQGGNRKKDDLLSTVMTVGALSKFYRGNKKTQVFFTYYKEIVSYIKTPALFT